MPRSGNINKGNQEVVFLCQVISSFSIGKMLVLVIMLESWNVLIIILFIRLKAISSMSNYKINSRIIYGYEAIKNE